MIIKTKISIIADDFSFSSYIYKKYTFFVIHKKVLKFSLQQVSDYAFEDLSRNEKITYIIFCITVLNYHYE